MTAPLLTVAKRGAEAAPALMEDPQGEWLTVLLYEGADGVVHTAALMSESLTDDCVMETQRTMYQVLTANGAVQAALVAPVWVAPKTDDQVRARDRSDRQERVMVIHVTRDATRTELAPVIRTESDKPRLGEWDAVYEGLAVGGGFPDVMRQAIG